MRIQSESVIHHPRDLVFKAYRDELPEIAAYMSDIEEIKVINRNEAGAEVRLHNVWVAQREIPSFARNIVRPEMLQWDDHAEWNQDTWTCDWQLKTRVFTDSVGCGGSNRFVAVDDNTTKVVLEGNLDIDLKDIPGVPRLLAGRIAPKVEAFIVSLITPNLKEVNASLQTYLDAKQA